MPDLRELYQEVILEHSKAPRNYRELATANHRAEGYKPLSGDHFTVFLGLVGDFNRESSFRDPRCVLSQRSAALSARSAQRNARVAGARQLDHFGNLVASDAPAGGDRAGEA